MFADDSKLFKRIHSLIDRDILQKDLLKLQEWSRKWLLQFNEEKTKVMHLHRQFSNPNYEYRLNDNTLSTTLEQVDLGIHVTPDFTFSAHVGKTAAKSKLCIMESKTYFFSYVHRYVSKDLSRLD